MTGYRPVRLAILGLSLLLSSALRGQEPGGSSGAFLERNASAPEASFGGIALPFSNETSAIFRDGSSLTQLEHPTVVLSASTHPDGQHLSGAGIGLPIGDDGGISLGITSYSVGDYRAFTADDRPIGTFSSSDIALSIGGGLSLGPASVGTTIRYLNSSLDGITGTGTGYALDLSASLRFLHRIVVGGVLSNAAGEMTWSGADVVREPLPWRLRLGGAYVVPFEERNALVRDDPSGRGEWRPLRPRSYLAAAIEGKFVRNGSDPVISLGIEWVPMADIPLGLRGGGGTDGDLGFGCSYAFGFEPLRSVRLDIALRLDHDLGRVTEHASLTAGF